jgi:pyridoxine 5-phosphate synthase
LLGIARQTLRLKLRDLGLQVTHSGRFARPNDKKRLEPMTAYRHPVLDKKFNVPDGAVLTDDDIARLKATIAKPLNLEMAATPEMVAIALRTKPHAACLVPERRAERTTEGGLDVVGGRADLGPKIAQLREANIRVSLFIAPDPAQIKEAAALGAAVIEIHTGSWCHALADGDKGAADAEWKRIQYGVKLAASLGLEVHAGHGLDYASAETIAAVPQIVELNIGHFLIGEAAFVGLAESVKSMRAAMNRGRARAIS